MPVIPLRKEPNDRSEILTQVLFGETVRIFDTRQKWISVETDLDNYPGWVDIKQVLPIEKKEHKRLKSMDMHLTTSALTPVNAGGKPVLLPACSSLPGLAGSKFTIAGVQYTIDGATKPFKRGEESGIIDTAMSYLNAPYLWGGKTHLGIDCSGLTQCVFRLNGINIPRDASQQANAGETINFLSEARPGDLAFFDDNEGRIVHVGLIVDSNHIIHASGMVRIDTLDHHGIFNEKNRSYSHQLRLIRRVTG